MSRAERIASKLGMSQGAANNKLRKTLLFTLAQRCALDICFKCKEKILCVDEFSIEHKLPWEGRDSSLFWNLENIAFSHMKCNRPHINKGGNLESRLALRKVDNSGNIWCNSCEKFLNSNCFSRNDSRWTGYQNQCNPCRSSNRSTHRK